MWIGDAILLKTFVQGDIIEVPMASTLLVITSISVIWWSVRSSGRWRKPPTRQTIDDQSPITNHLALVSD